MAFDRIVAAYREAKLLVLQIEMSNYVETSCGHNLKNNIHFCKLKELLSDGDYIGETSSGDTQDMEVLRTKVGDNFEQEVSRTGDGKPKMSKVWTVSRTGSFGGG